MQWDAANAQAGFSANPHTWLPVTGNYKTVNVASETADPHSLLNWYRALIKLRRTSAALRAGRTVMLDRTNSHVLSYVRVAADGGTVLVALNLSGEQQTFRPGLAAAGLPGTRVKTLLASPAPVAGGAADRTLTLEPFAAWVAAVN
jgi:alpha-glucosidase